MYLDLQASYNSFQYIPIYVFFLGIHLENLFLEVCILEYKELEGSHLIVLILKSP